MIFLPSIFLADDAVISSAAISQLILAFPWILLLIVKSKYSPAVNLTFPVASVVGKAPVILIVLVDSSYSIVIAPVVIVLGFLPSPTNLKAA